MAELAINGGTPAVTSEIARFDEIGNEEAYAAFDAIRHRPLSGYLGGERKGGYYVERLEQEFAGMIGVRA